MRAVFWLFISLIAIVLALFAVSNRGAVLLEFWPLPSAAAVPLYLLVLAAVLFGFVVGRFSAWFAAGRWRREVNRRGRRIAALERELAATQATHEPFPVGNAALPATRP